ncbi:MAG: hypothetical protein Q9160_004171 [Pyrenula sp. 1 TL-2023]
MHDVDDTLSAAATILHNLARGASTPREASPYAAQPEPGYVNGLTLQSYTLPGKKTPAKQSFEAELAALSRRIQYLESRADSVNQTLPDTPNEFQQVTSPFDKGDGKTPPSPLSRHASGTTPRSHHSNSNRSARVLNLLAARDLRNGDNDASRTVSESDIGYLRDHVEKQSEEIKTQKAVIEKVSQELHEQGLQTEQTLEKVENDDVGILERELRKHQQANEAFQKALREIGSIITRVANGDLSMRVQIHPIEMDPEIGVFKKTINNMMDQLEVFGSEVSRVAREVGTEGILGGQAQIKDVHGVWKELTDNGKSIPRG